MLNTTNHLLVLATILTLFVVSFVHVFLFPLYETAPIIPKQGFISDYEQMLCETKLPIQLLRAHRSKSKQPCPRDGIVTVFQGGQLGNQISEYAGVWGIARRTGLEPYVPGCIRHRLDQIFENLSVPPLSQISHCPMQWNSFVKSLDVWNFTNQSILLRRYFADADVFQPWIQDLRQEFTIKVKLVNYAQRVLTDAKIKLNRTDVNNTFIGVHVRRTDYMHLLRKYHFAPVGSEYFLKAMRYFEKKYRYPIFIIISDDPVWCLKYLGKRHNTYIVNRVNKKNSADQDFALMAACNHSIFDYGTYGTWGAILAGGETVVHNVKGWASTETGKLLSWHIL